MRKNVLVIGVAAIVILGIGGAWWYVASSKAPSFSGTAATKGNVVQSVDEPGTVLAENSVTLSFQGAGQIASVNVQEGDAVSAGEVLASLDASSLVAGLEQASATYAAAVANLDQLASGTRPEQLQVNQSAVASAAAAVSSAQASLGTAAGSAYTAADDAVHNQTDNLFSNPQTNNPTFLVSISDTQMGINIVNARMALNSTLTNWFSAVTATTSDSVAEASLASTNLKQIQSYLDTLALAVNDATPNSSVSVAALAGYKMNIVTARTEVTAAITALTTAQNALTTAKSALTVAQNQLLLAQAGATPQSIEAQQAVVLQAHAAVTNAQIALGHAELIAPFSGTVQNLTAKIGQVVAPGSPMLSVTNDSGIKVVAYASQADVGKIALHDAANVTLDTYGTGTMFPATVTAIDNSETQVNGSPAYQMTLHFSKPDNRIKDGMTGNVHIITAEHDGVVEVPSRMVINQGNGDVVLVKNGTTAEQRSVQVGIIGNDGMTEITSGVSVGDQLVNF